jgi:hypothetical protein
MTVDARPDTRPRFALVIEALPSEVRPAIRLRAALKRLLRSFKLRCIRVDELPPGGPLPKGTMEVSYGE